MMKTWVLAVLAVAATSAAVHAQTEVSDQPGLSSAYTRIALADCDVVEGNPETGDFVWRCEGLNGTPVWVAERHLRMYVSYGEAGLDALAWQQTPNGFNGLADPFTIEWRLSEYDMAHAAMGQDYPEEYDSPRPFATILRWNVSDPETSEPLQYLVVTQLGDGGICHSAYVNARQENANVIARQTAAMTAAFDCELDDIWMR